MWHKEKLRGIKLIKCSNYLGLSRTKRDLGGFKGNFETISMQVHASYVSKHSATKTNISAAKKPSQLAFSQADINLNTNFDQKSFNQTFKVNLNIITHTFRIQTNSNIEEN